MAIESIILGLNLYTQHFSDEIPTNHATTGIYLILDSKLTIGTIKNCINHRSNYLGYTISTPLGTNLTLGGITGYSSLTGKSLSPMVLLSKSFGPMRVTLLPKNPQIKKSSPAFSLSLEKEFK